jgi:hypothetical protein
MAQVAHREERTLGDLLRELTHEMGVLLRQEMKLAKAEATEKVSRAGRSIFCMAAGGLITFAGVLFILAAAMLSLALVMQMWLASLIVGVFAILVGLTVASMGRENLKSEKITLSKTAESLKEDSQWAKAQMP